MELNKSPDNIIDDIVKSNIISRFETELKFNNNTDRTYEIENIIKSLKGNVIDNENKKSRDKLNIMLEEQDNYTLKKKWHKLELKQKIDRIKHFCSTKINKDIQETEKYLLDNIDKIKTAKHINYDVVNGEIIAIEILR